MKSEMLHCKLLVFHSMSSEAIYLYLRNGVKKKKIYALLTHSYLNSSRMHFTIKLCMFD